MKPSRQSVVALAIITAVAGRAQAEDRPDPEADRQGAIACAAEHAGLKASFKLDFERSDVPAMSAYYSATTGEWTQVEGDEASLKKDMKTAWHEPKSRFGKPGGLVPDQIDRTIRDTDFIEETQEARIYSFVPYPNEGEKPMPGVMIDALERRFIIDKATGCMAGFSMTSTKSFKPAPIATIKSFRIEQTFMRPQGAPIPVISGFTSKASGTAMFRDFDEVTAVTVSQIDILADS